MYDLTLLIAASAALGAAAALGYGPVVRRIQRLDRGIARTLRDEMTAAGMDITRLPVYLLVWRGLAVGTLVFVGGVLKLVPVGVMLSIIAFNAAPWWVRLRIAAYRRRVNEQVSGAARSLAGQVRVGLPLNEALGAVSVESPAPLGDHLRRTARQMAQGDDVRSALGALRDRVKVEAVSALTIALQVAEERGGRLADVLDRIAQCAEEISRIERKRETDTAAGRLMVVLMAVFPAAFLGFVYFLDPALADNMFNTLPGQCVLGVVIGIVYASTRWAGRILSKLE